MSDKKCKYKGSYPIEKKRQALTDKRQKIVRAKIKNAGTRKGISSIKRG